MVMLLLTTSTASSTPLSLQERLRRKEVAMGVSNGIVTAPINAQEPYTAQGIGKYNGTWWDIVYGCANANGKINQWAKYKPERINTIMDITEDQRRSNMYGFSIPQISTANLNEDAVWTYLPPVPGTDWCRQNDFDGYDHNSVVPIAIFFPSYLYSDAPQLNYIYIDMDDDLQLAQGNVMIRDIFYNYLNWYLGVIVYNKTKKIAIWKTAAVTLANFENGTEIPVPIISTWTGSDNIELYAILSRYSYTGEPGDTPPLDHDAFYLQYEAGKGHMPVKISVRFPVQSSIVVVGNPTITFYKQWYNGAYHWHVSEMRYQLKNNATKNLNLYLSSYLQDDNNGEIYDLENSSTVSIPQNATVTVYQDANIFIPSTTAEVYVEILAIGIYGDGGNGVIFARYYNFNTNTWHE